MAKDYTQIVSFVAKIVGVDNKTSINQQNPTLQTTIIRHFWDVRTTINRHSGWRSWSISTSSYRVWRFLSQKALEYPWHRSFPTGKQVENRCWLDNIRSHDSGTVKTYSLIIEWNFCNIEMLIELSGPGKASLWYVDNAGRRHITVSARELLTNGEWRNGSNNESWRRCKNTEWLK